MDQDEIKSVWLSAGEIAQGWLAGDRMRRGLLTAEEAEHELATAARQTRIPAPDMVLVQMRRLAGLSG
jgi:hypothetical protein